MALTDILFTEGETHGFIAETPSGVLNSPDDIVFDTQLVSEIGPSYVDPALIAEAIWTYENRQLTG